MRISTVIIIIFLLLMPVVVAYNLNTNINSNLPDFHTDVYRCTDGSACNAIIYFASVNSGGTTNSYTLTGTGNHYYTEYDYKSCYAPHIYQTHIWDPYSGTDNYAITLAKKPNCTSTINTITMSSNNITLGQAVTITVDAQSAFEYPNGIPTTTAIPAAIAAEYSPTTAIKLFANKVEIGQLVQEILIGESRNYTFTFTPLKAGTYTISTDSDVTDCQCSGTAVLSASAGKLQVNAPPNTAPVMAGVPDVGLFEDSGLGDDVVDLWAYAVDAETADENLSFSIVFESDIGVVDCSVDSNRFVDCVTQADQNGFSDVTVMASDGLLNDTDVFRVNVSAVNDAPVANFTFSPQNPAAGVVVLFDASSSYDVDGDKLSYGWSFGDGFNGTGSGVVHAYLSAGLYNVTLIVSDGTESGFLMKQVNVSSMPNTAPVVAVTSPNGGEVVQGNYNITWAAFDADGDPLAIALQYSIDNSSWSSIASGIPNTGIYEWDASGLNSTTTLVKAIANDWQASTEDVSDGYFTIVPVPGPTPISNLVITANPESGEAPLEVDFGAIIYGGTAPFIYQWDFDNDGAIDSTHDSPTHIFADSGIHIVCLTVTGSASSTYKTCKRIKVAKEHVDIAKRKIAWTKLDLMGSEVVHPGDYVQGVVTFVNHDNYKIKDMSITLLIMGLDSRKKLGPFNVKSGDEVTRHFVLDIPAWAEPGFYDIRATVSSDTVRRVKHREIIVE